METLKNKIVFITGASSGIGKSTAIEFAKNGAYLIITARRIERINELADFIRKEYAVKVLPFQMDVKNYKLVKNVISNLPFEWQNIDILVNNAGIGRGLNKLHEDNVDGWEEMIDTNIKGLLYVSREIIPLMVKNQTGHIINIGSIAGHEAYGGGAVYCATKHSVTAITRSMRIELLDKGIRVSTIDPGMVETEFSLVRFYGDSEKANNVYKGLTPLSGNDIADAVIFCATRPKHTNINEMIIMPSQQANAFINFRKS